MGVPEPLLYHAEGDRTELTIAAPLVENTWCGLANCARLVTHPQGQHSQYMPEPGFWRRQCVSMEIKDKESRGFGNITPDPTGNYRITTGHLL
jgi:hypothetical protein